MAAIFGVDGLVVALLVLVPLGVVVYGAVDAALLPAEAWRATGQSKLLWIILPFGGLLLCIVAGPIMTAIYLAATRPRVRSAQRRRER
jgi:uncharacterized membrane protein